MSEKESVNKLFAALHAERVATYRPEELAVNINQRRALFDHFDKVNAIKAGDIVDNFILPEVDGGIVSLADLLAKGPVVLLFFRFAGCPACNLALPYYQRQLYPHLQALGISLLAISPQIPERLVDIKQRQKLDFWVASDVDNKLGRRFGITFIADEPSQAAMRAKGADLGEITGTGTWELPMPAVILLGRDGQVQFADISPDWLVRAEADVILDAVRRYVGVCEAA